MDNWNAPQKGGGRCDNWIVFVLVIANWNWGRWEKEKTSGGERELSPIVLGGQIGQMKKGGVKGLRDKCGASIYDGIKGGASIPFRGGGGGQRTGEGVKYETGYRKVSVCPHSYGWGVQWHRKKVDPEISWIVREFLLWVRCQKQGKNCCILAMVFGC